MAQVVVRRTEKPGVIQTRVRFPGVGRFFFVFLFFLSFNFFNFYSLSLSLSLCLSV